MNKLISFTLICLIILPGQLISKEGEKGVKIEKISCKDLKIKTIDRKKMTEEEIKKIINENLQKKMSKSDKNCIDLSDKTASSGASSEASTVSASMFSNAENKKDTESKFETKNTDSSSSKESNGNETSVSVPLCIRHMEGNNPVLKQLKERIAKEQNADRKKELTKRFIQFSGHTEEEIKCKF